MELYTKSKIMELGRQKSLIDETIRLLKIEPANQHELFLQMYICYGSIIPAVRMINSKGFLVGSRKYTSNDLKDTIKNNELEITHNLREIAKNIYDKNHKLSLRIHR